MISPWSQSPAESVRLARLQMPGYADASGEFGHSLQSDAACCPADFPCGIATRRGVPVSFVCRKDSSFLFRFRQPGAEYGCAAEFNV
jgi:hypothetical protein